MNLFAKMRLSFVLIIMLIIGAMLTTFVVVYSVGFEERVVAENDSEVIAIARNGYFEILYAQRMDEMQTGRSSGNLGNRKERWWFKQME